MSTTLYLVRHAIAEEYSAGGDTERTLTPEGEEKMRAGARGLERLGVRPDLVLTSPLRRALQTARIVCEVLDRRLEPTTCAQLAPGHSGSSVLRALGASADLNAIVLVGHEPDLGQLASFLLTGSPGAAVVPFKKGGVAAIQMESFEAKARGALLFFLTPKQLRMLADAHD